MRAREFVTEQKELPPEYADPMRDTYIIPGLSAADPYKNYRFGVAMARARSEYAKTLSPLNKGIDPHIPAWDPDTAFGEHGVVAGFNSGVGKIIDAALSMTNTSGGKKLVSTSPSEEPALVNTASPVRAFIGYPR